MSDHETTEPGSSVLVTASGKARGIQRIGRAVFLHGAGSRPNFAILLSHASFIQPNP